MLIFFLIVIGFLMRLIPHVPNITPIAAIAIFSAAYLNKKVYVWIPFVIMVVTDLFIVLHEVIFFTWGSFILISFFGRYLKNNLNVKNIFIVSVFSSLIFFIVSNFGVWLMFYPHSIQGFYLCFLKAIPFFRNTFFSNVIFSFLFFGIYEFLSIFIKKTSFSKILLVK